MKRKDSNRKRRFELHITKEFEHTWKEFSNLVYLDPRINKSKAHNPDKIISIGVRSMIKAYVDKYRNEFVTTKKEVPITPTTGEEINETTQTTNQA